MNIFILSESPVIAAQYQCDKHVVKMILESAQMLCSAVGGEYRITHLNHPCTRWVRENQSNFRWLGQHAFALCEEYTYRYGKVHKSERIILDCYTRANTLPEGELTPFPMAMPVELQSENVVESYRRYYHTKSSFAKWTRREVPYWWSNNTVS